MRTDLSIFLFSMRIFLLKAAFRFSFKLWMATFIRILKFEWVFLFRINYADAQAILDLLNDWRNKYDVEFWLRGLRFLDIFRSSSLNYNKFLKNSNWQSIWTVKKMFSEIKELTKETYDRAFDFLDMHEVVSCQASEKKDDYFQKAQQRVRDSIASNDSHDSLSEISLGGVMKSSQFKLELNASSSALLKRRFKTISSTTTPGLKITMLSHECIPDPSDRQSEPVKSHFQCPLAF